MMGDASDWSRAYARQAEADLATWERLLRDRTVPECHRMIFLQMACEKLAKAHLCRIGGKIERLQSSHIGTAKTLPAIILQRLVPTRKGSDTRRILAYSRQLCGEIEMLAPSIHREGRRPDNCEYPWEDRDGRIYSPLDWSFTPADLLLAPIGPTFLKLVKEAVAELLA